MQNKQSLKNEIIGVTSIGSLTDISKLKQELLMFDRLAFSDDSFLLSFLKSKGMAHNVNEVEWLLQEGLVFKYEPDVDQELNHDPEHKLHLQLIDIAGGLAKKALANAELHSGKVSFPGTDIRNIARFHDECYCRLKAYHLRRLEGCQAYPLFYHNAYTIKLPITPKTKVLQMSLGFLPTPDETTSWEQILDYRADPDSKNKFIVLKNWINEISKSNIPEHEIEKKLEWLIFDYQRHLKLHRLKNNMGNFETIVVTTMDILENLTKMKWGKLARSFFSVRQRKIASLEAELNLPGAEIAYLVKAKEQFERLTT